jgi:hypothetical protein
VACAPSNGRLRGGDRLDSQRMRRQVPRPEMVGAASCEVGHATQRKVMPKPILSRPPPPTKSSTSADRLLNREDRVSYL